MMPQPPVHLRIDEDWLRFVAVVIIGMMIGLLAKELGMKIIGVDIGILIILGLGGAFCLLGLQKWIRGWRS